MTMERLKLIAFSALCFFLTLFIAEPCFSQTNKPKYIEPGIVAPGKGKKAPSDAIVLFDKGSLHNFESVIDGRKAGWFVKGKKFMVNPEATDIQTKQHFGSCQLHIEWKTPAKDVRKGKEGQGNGNSGIYLMSKYEVQVLNSYENKTNPDGQAAAIYGTHPPLVNASFKPGKWQSYDIIFTAPEFDEEGYIDTPGYFTVFHNGVLVQNHVATGRPTAAYNKRFPRDAQKLPIMLQNHSNEVSYRNIWIREL